MYFKYILYYSATVVIVVLILRSIEIISRINNLDNTPLYLWQMDPVGLKWLLFAVLCFTSLSFYIFIWRFALKTGPVVERQNVPTTKISSRTVHISNIPRLIPFAELEEVIKQLIAMCFPRAQTSLVTVVPDYEQLTHLQAKHNSLSEKLESIRQAKSAYLVNTHSNLIGGKIEFDTTGAQKQKQKSEKKIKKLKEKEAKIFSKLDKVEQQIDDELELQSNSNTGHAFITFTNSEAAAELINRGFSKKRMMGRQMSLSSYKYKTWIFDQANEPYQINWENLGKTSHNNCLYKAYQYALLLAISFTALFIVFMIERISYFVNHYFLVNLSHFMEYAVKVFTPLLAFFFIWYLLPKICIYLTKGELIKTRSVEQSSYYRKVFVFSFLSTFVYGFFILFMIQYYFRQQSFDISKTKAREELVSFAIRYMIHSLFISTWYRINRNPNEKLRLFSQTHDYDHVLTSQYSEDIHLHLIFLVAILMTANILLQKSPLFGFLMFGFFLVKVSLELTLQYYSEKYVVLLDTESQFDIYDDFLNMNLHSALLVQKLVVIVYLQQMSLPIWFILLILFLFIVIYCIVSRYIRRAAKSKGNVIISSSGKVELTRQQSEGYAQVVEICRYMEQEADSYLHPAFKYYRMPQQKLTQSRKASLNFNTKLSYTGNQSPRQRRMEPDEKRTNENTSLLLFSN